MASNGIPWSEIRKKLYTPEELEEDVEPKIIRNRAWCRKCGSIVESKSAHDLQTCSCGAISVDGGLEYLRRLAEPADVEELSEVEMPIWDETAQQYI